MKRSISFVIPNYNGNHLLEKNIPSWIAAAHTSRIDFEIIVVDDASTESPEPLLKKKFPEIRLIKNNINKGFAPTANAGILKAKKDLVFLVNNDISIAPDYFESQFRYFDDPQTFGVMGRIMTEDGSAIRDAAKYPQLGIGGIHATTNYIPITTGYNDSLFTFFISGANALLDRQKIVQIGGLDEAFAPFYNEDVELSLRAWRLGWTCYYENQAVCFHPLSTTINSYHKKSDIRVIALRNRMYLNLLHLSRFSCLIYTGIIFTRFLLSWLIIDRTFYRSFFGLCRMGKALKKAKADFKEATVKTGTEISLRHVVKRIMDSCTGKEIRKF